MTTALARQIEARLRAKNMTVLELERLAGLKGHGVRNIIRGKSKKPSAQSLDAIGDMLGCTVKELLTLNDIFPEDENMPTREEVLESKFKPTPLLNEVTAFVMNNWNKGGENHNQVLNMQQILSSIHEITLNSLQRSLDHMDENFARWYLRVMEG